jgi:HSP20 family protein
MATYRWDPFTTLARLDREFDGLVRHTWPAPRARVVRTARPGAAGFVPPVELVRDGSDVIVRAELPGIDIDKDVSVEVERGRLVISGERRGAREDNTDGVLVREVRYGSFRRAFALPEGVSADAIEATYDAGILEVRVRGAVQEVEGAKRIPVTAGSASALEPAASAESAQEPAQELPSEPASEDGATGSTTD